MQVESEITIGRSAQDVFDYVAHAECLPEYVSDFDDVSPAWARAIPRLGTQYRYTMKRGAEGTFEWTRFEPTSVWPGRARRSRPARVDGALGLVGVTPSSRGTRVKLVMAPTPGGLFKLLAPLHGRGHAQGQRGRTRAPEAAPRGLAYGLELQYVADRLKPLDETLHVGRRVVHGEGGTRGGGDAELAHQRLGAVVPSADADALTAQDLADVVRVGALE